MNVFVVYVGFKVFVTIESKCVVSSETQKELKHRTIPETHPKSTIEWLPLKQKLYPKREKNEKKKQK